MESAEAPSLFRSLVRGDRFGGFSLIHSDASTEETTAYNPCGAMADNAVVGSWAKPASMRLLQANAASVPSTGDWIAGIGGNKAVSFAQRAMDCDGEVRTARLFVASECRAFFAQDWSGAVIVKHALGAGASDGVVLYPSLAALASAWGACDGADSAAQWLASVFVESGLVLAVRALAYPSGSRPLEGFARDIQHAGSDWEPPATPMGVPDTVEDRAKRVLAVFQGLERVPLSLRALLLVASSREPLVALSLLVGARSVRRHRCQSHDDGGVEFDTVAAGELEMDANELAKVLSLESVAPQHYVDSVLEPMTRRMARRIIAGARASMLREPRGSALFALDFAVDSTLRPVLVGVSTMDVERYAGPHAAAVRKAREQVGRMAVDAPAYLARARFGDAFGAMRFVWNDVEEARWGAYVPACFKMPAREDMQTAVTLENYAQKKSAARRRDLKKRVGKKWDVCKRRRSGAEKCMGGTLSALYRAAVRRDGLVAGDEKAWVEEALKQLEGMPLQSGGRGGEVD